MSQIESAFQHPPDNLQKAERPSQVGGIQENGAKQRADVSGKGVQY